MYFINYFYVSVTDAAPKCPLADSSASSWSCAEFDPTPSWPRIGIADLSHFVMRRSWTVSVHNLLDIARIWCILALKFNIWLQRNKLSDFPENQVTKFHAEFPNFMQNLETRE